MSAWTGWPKKSAWTGQIGQDAQHITARHPGQDSQNRTARIGKLGDKSTETDTGQVGQASWRRQRWQERYIRMVRKDRTGQPIQKNLEKGQP
jgi:hypothetical protein